MDHDATSLYAAAALAVWTSANPNRPSLCVSEIARIRAVEVIPDRLPTMTK